MMCRIIARHRAQLPLLRGEMEKVGIGLPHAEFEPGEQA